jgi:triosephosphate isomerase
MTRKPLIAGNWKMNLTQQEGIELVRRLLALLRDQVHERVDVAVLPPFTHIRSVQALTADDPRSSPD